MYVYVFKGADRLLGFTTDPSGSNLPTSQGQWSLVNRLTMARDDDPRPIVQTHECLNDLEMHGFHITRNFRSVTDSIDQ
jgi:hypothetical protein